VGRVGFEDVARHQPVEQHAQRRKVLLHTVGAENWRCSSLTNAAT
jgi:hypothetical protein